MSIDITPRNTDADSSLLEGLFQLVVAGHTGGHEFDQLTAAVYERLQDAYVRQDTHANALYSRTAA
ncbi:MAG TPA: hypothetical protein VGC74_01045 [Stenotrophomonas sp.]|jgi:hypothetical protein